jgi:hypothetical protein
MDKIFGVKKKEKKKSQVKQQGVGEKMNKRTKYEMKRKR